ncbi:MAG TPA: AAA family ATPase, partial [Ktedonobacteraceae bacterium]
SGRTNQSRIDEVLDLVELRVQAKMVYRKYSLGMKQRLGIAAALLTDPQLVLLDEPTNGLDPAGMFEIRQLIHRLAALGKTIFISSHLLNEVQQVCNRVAILQKGNLIKQGNVHELLSGSEQIMVRMNDDQDLQQAFAILQTAKEQGAHWLASVRMEKNRRGELTLRINAPKARSAEINAILARNELYAAELHPFEGSLEEVYLELTSAPVLTGANTGMASLSRGLSGAERSAFQSFVPTASAEQTEARFNPTSSASDSIWSSSDVSGPASQSQDNRTRGIE